LYVRGASRPGENVLSLNEPSRAPEYSRGVLRAEDTVRSLNELSLAVGYVRGVSRADVDVLSLNEFSRELGYSRGALRDDDAVRSLKEPSLVLGLLVESSWYRRGLVEAPVLRIPLSIAAVRDLWRQNTDGRFVGASLTDIELTGKDRNMTVQGLWSSDDLGVQFRL
jgi:hypothetical protein